MKHKMIKELASPLKKKRGDKWWRPAYKLMEDTAWDDIYKD